MQAALKHTETPSPQDATAADPLQAYVGRTETSTARLHAAMAGMLGATLLQEWASDSAFQTGETAPALWHWAAFPPTTPMRGLGLDGHPKKGGDGDFLPDVGLERRMWAGGALTFHTPLHIGETMTRRSTIKAVQEKTGGAGRMVFVTVAHEIEGEAGLAISERQDIVYLKIPERFSPPVATPAPEAPDHAETVEIDTVRLFRYSACTFNAHRIHYDLAYAQEVEKYPGLVVHGPLQATLLMGAATRWRGSTPKTFRFRGVRPMFHTHALHMFGVNADDAAHAMDLCTADPGGAQGMQARATWS